MDNGNSASEYPSYRIIQRDCPDILWSYHLHTGRFSYSTGPDGAVETLDPRCPPRDHRSVLVDASFRFVTDLLGKNNNGSLEYKDPVLLEIPVQEEILPGDSLFLELRLSSMKSGQGVISGIIGITRDITGEKRLENTLMKSEALYRTLIKVSPEAMIILDQEGDIVKANNRAADLLNCSRSEIIGSSLIDYIIEDQRDDFRDCFTEISTDHRADNGGFTILRGDGSQFVAEISVSDLCEESAGVEARIVVIRDISARKKAEEEIRLSEEQYSNLIEAMNEGLIIFDWNLLIGYINRSASEIFGYSLDEILGSPLKIIFDDKSYQKLEKHLVKSRTTDGYKKKFELNAIKKNGETACVLVSLSTITSRSGKYLGSFAVVTDITRERNAERQRRKVEKKLLDLFLNRLSERETELLRYLINGYKWPEQKREICKQMDVLPSTLDKFMSRIRTKMDIDDIDTILSIARRRIKAV